MKLIELIDIHKTYQLDGIEVPVLRGISLSIGRGEYVALMGTSGSGKTTLMNILGCLDRPSSGEYLLDGLDMVKLSADERALQRNRRIGFVFQNFNLLARTCALDNVIMPLTYAAEHLNDEECRKRAVQLLQNVGLGDRLDHESSQLSGGQQQRVAIARSLVNRPSILFADEPTGNLDSRTSQEVLEIFRRLNEEEGVTIVLVTHDEEVARHARRVVRIRDGVVEAEQVDESCDVPAPGIVKKQTAGETTEGPSAWALSQVRHHLRRALNGLHRNKMRAALTALGIVIGVAAVIAMMEIGRGSSVAIQKTIASMGANNLLIMPGAASSGGITFGAGSGMSLTPQDSDAIVVECPGLRGAAPVVRSRTQVIYGNRNWVPNSIYGTTPSFLDVRDWPLEEGEPFTNQDVRNGSKVCLLGQTLVRELFQGEPPIGKEVRVKNVPFKVMGILSPKGANMMGMDQDDILLAPWTAIKYRVTGTTLGSVNQSAASSSSDTSQQVNTLNRIYPSTGVILYPQPSAVQLADTPLPVRFASIDQIFTAARSSQDVAPALQQIKRVLRERHRLRQDEPDDFTIRDMTEVTKALSSTAVLMTKLLLVVALISLVVGGVGIMNIMLVSVTERTREIGLRLAVGARGKDILKQFLTESIVLCFLGGAAGICLGRGISYLVRITLSWPTQLSLDAIAAAFAVSAAVGILFGYYPAWKASRVDPIIAMRYE